MNDWNSIVNIFTADGFSLWWEDHLGLARGNSVSACKVSKIWAREGGTGWVERGCCLTFLLLRGSTSMKKKNNIRNINIEILELQVVADNNSIFNLILYGLKEVCWNVVIHFPGYPLGANCQCTKQLKCHVYNIIKDDETVTLSFPLIEKICQHTILHSLQYWRGLR